MHWMFLMGVITGMRSMTGLAVMSWCARLGLLAPVNQTWAHWVGSDVCVVLFTLFALGEYVGDILPQTPSRTSFFPATARFLIGGLVGAIAAASQLEPAAGGAILGAMGAVVGTWGGAWFRELLIRRWGSNARAGLTESALVLAVAIADGHWIHLSAARSVIQESVRLFM
jgi:uncharacterized membrane protein